MDKDTELKLGDLARLLIRQVRDDLDGFKLVITDWEISGRKGRHVMIFKHKIIATIDGEDYCLSEAEAFASEEGDLILQLPKDAMTLGEHDR